MMTEDSDWNEQRAAATEGACCEEVMERKKW
jgi:hypothetical protein